MITQIKVVKNSSFAIFTNKVPELSGMTVGSLKDRLFDSIVITQHEGRMREFPFNDTVLGIMDMIQALQDKHIDGFLLNRPTYYYFSRVLEQYYPEMAAKVSQVKLTRTEKFFRGNRLVAGMGVKDSNVYNFFKSYFESNWLQIQGCYASELNSKHRKIEREENKRSHFIGGLLVPFFYLGGFLLLLILCFGVLYEIRRRKMLASETQT